VTKNLELLAQISKHCAERQQEVNGLVELLSDNIVLARHDEAYELAEVLLPNAEVMNSIKKMIQSFAMARLQEIERRLNVMYDTIIEKPVVVE
jgi:hypothetical protein